MVSVADTFLEDGTIVYIQGRNQADRKDFYATKDADDVKDWAKKLTPGERNLLTQIFRFFVQADVAGPALFVSVPTASITPALVAGDTIAFDVDRYPPG